MLQLLNTRFGHTFHREVALGHVITTEGVALGYVMENGKAKVRPSTGEAGERFAGFSLSRNSQAHRLTKVVNAQVPALAPYKITLSHTPNENELRVSGFELTTDPVEAGKVTLVGKELEFAAADAGKMVEICFAFTPTVLEAVQVAGNDPVGGLPSTGLGTIGVVIEGDVYTDQFDVTADWNGNGRDPVNVYLGAGGLLTTKTGGTLLGNVVVIAVPTAGAAFLGLSVRSAN